MRLDIGFEDINRSRVHNWDPTRSKMQEGSVKNVFEALEPSKIL
jgi:hypothetical protein